MEGISVDHLGHGLLCSLFLILLEIVVLDISMELPDVYAIVLSCSDDHTVIIWVEESLQDWESVPNESLVEGRDVLLSIIVPHLDKVIFSSSEHEASVLTEVSACDGSSMNRAQLSQVNTLKAGQ